MRTAVPRHPGKGKGDTTDRTAQAVVDATVDYSDEVTVEQMGQIEKALESLNLSNWKVKAGPTW